MKTRSILSAAIGSVFFASAILMLIPTVASATFQNAGSPPRVSQATPSHASQATRPVGTHLSAQQMRATKGALGMICSGDCNPGIDGCDLAAAGGGVYVRAFFHHQLVCVQDNNWGLVYSYCTTAKLVDCYDYEYHQGTCGGALLYNVPHNLMSCNGQ